ncbi:hypothetical protein IEQ34_021499 [Dendrobium chrysotoxum]|uniref:Transmembrane protein n=1 Tax=Dendrobium chrysotoxum TaxID=161865 RepID=A0AAV7G3N3_DENCH|nr:hypothetical protein IEQ34_021499 [Dendrobium chrysotoxum]
MERSEAFAHTELLDRNGNCWRDQERERVKVFSCFDPAPLGFPLAPPGGFGRTVCEAFAHFLSFIWTFHHGAPLGFLPRLLPVTRASSSGKFPSSPFIFWFRMVVSFPAWLLIEPRFFRWVVSFSFFQRSSVWALFFFVVP